MYENERDYSRLQTPPSHVSRWEACAGWARC